MWRGEHITNSVIGVYRPPVLDCGTTFHLDYGGRDLPWTPSDQLWNLICLPTEALSDSVEFIATMQINYNIEVPCRCRLRFSVCTACDSWAVVSLSVCMITTTITVVSQMAPRLAQSFIYQRSLFWPTDRLMEHQLNHHNHRITVIIQVNMR